MVSSIECFVKDSLGIITSKDGKLVQMFDVQSDGILPMVRLETLHNKVWFLPLNVDRKINVHTAVVQFGRYNFESCEIIVFLRLNIEVWKALYRQKRNECNGISRIWLADRLQ